MRKLGSFYNLLWLFLLIASIIFAYLYVNSRGEVIDYKQKLENGDGEIARIKGEFNERMDRELRDNEVRTKIKTTFGLFNAPLSPKVDIYMGEYQKVANDFKMAEYTCENENLDKNEELSGLLEKLKIEGEPIFWCKEDELKGLVVVLTDLNPVAYMISTDGDRNFFSQSDLIGVRSILAKTKVELLSWKKLVEKNNQYYYWLKFRVTEYMESTNKMWGMDQYNSYTYVWASGDDAQLVEMCNKSLPNESRGGNYSIQSCSHITKTTNPVLGY